MTLDLVAATQSRRRLVTSGLLVLGIVSIFILSSWLWTSAGGNLRVSLSPVDLRLQPEADDALGEDEGQLTRVNGTPAQAFRGAFTQCLCKLADGGLKRSIQTAFDRTLNISRLGQQTDGVRKHFLLSLSHLIQNCIVCFLQRIK